MTPRGNWLWDWPGGQTLVWGYLLQQARTFLSFQGPPFTPTCLDWICPEMELDLGERRGRWKAYTTPPVPPCHSTSTLINHSTPTPHTTQLHSYTTPTAQLHSYSTPCSPPHTAQLHSYTTSRPPPHTTQLHAYITPHPPPPHSTITPIHSYAVHTLTTPTSLF